MTDRQRIAFVTGAASGIGRAVCQSLHGKGCRIVLADREEGHLATLAGEFGANVFPLHLDITDGAAVANCLGRLPLEFRDIDILVNNAGHDIGGRTRFDIGSADDWSASVSRCPGSSRAPTVGSSWRLTSAGGRCRSASCSPVS